MTIENIQNLLIKCYSKDLCYPKVQDNWSEFNKFSDVVGNIYEVNGYKILPIYHLFKRRQFEDAR